MLQLAENIHPADYTGYQILESVGQAKHFNRWMFSTFRPYVGQRVLEAGCGIGNFTELLLDRQRLLCVDHDPFYLEVIRQRYGHLEHISTRQVDLANPSDYEDLRREEPDTIICLNVVEHIEADRQVLREYFETLVPGGHAVVLVPAHMFLYSHCDRMLGHFRRYSRRELADKMRAAGFEVLSVREFNRLGVLGWLLNKLSRRGDLTAGQMRMYERLLPFAKLADALRLGPGLSVIAVGRKPR